MAAPDQPPLPSPPASETIRSIWLGLAEIRRTAAGKRRIHIRWLRLVSLGAGGTIVCWLLGALSLYFFFKVHRGYEDERFLDMLFLPFHLQEHNHQMGEYFIHRAKWNFDNRRWPEALQDYRIGLMKVPEDLDARTILAEFYSYYYRTQINKSLELLEDGLPYAIDSNPQYVRGYLLKLQKYHFPDKAIEVSRTYLAKDLKNPQMVYIFATSLASVLIEQGRYDEAEEVIKKYNLTTQLDGAVLNAQLLWEDGRHKSAVKFLEDARKRFGNNNPYLLGMLALYYRDLGDLDKAHMYIVLRGINAPNDPDPQIELLYIYAKTGEQKKLNDAVQEILDNYHDNEAAMLKLANYATNQGDILLARRVFELASQNPKFNIAPFCILVIEAFLTVKEYQNAISFIDQIKHQNPPWYKQFESVVESLRAVANYGNGQSDLADIFLTALLKDETPRPDVMREIANRFYSIGGLSEAQRLLQAAHHEDPNSQSILTQLITVDLQLGSSADLSANIRSLLKMRRPPIELLLDADRMLGSDRFIFVTDREQLLDELDRYIRNAAARRVVDE